jgi:adenylate cyclase
MGEDEEGTHREVSSRLDVLTRAVERHGGRIGHYAGDALLADFDSVIDALCCALSTQRELETASQGVPPEKRARFRIGINLGEVITDRGEVYGDGVNIAARLESLAEPGGVCVSEAVRVAAGTQLPVDFRSLGEQSVKNIAQPVRAYHTQVLPGQDLPTPQGVRRWRARRAYTIATAVLLAIVLCVTLWMTADSWLPSEERSLADFAGIERPTVAVLPFESLGLDESDRYLSDGITTDVIASLSLFSNLAVIASHSVFALHEDSRDPRMAAQTLGARYIVDGKLQRSGSRLRVTAHLVDASSSRTLWSERFERKREDVFELQDAITERIVRTLAVKLDEIEKKRAFAKSTDSLQAYEFVLRGRSLVSRVERQSNFEARKVFRKAIEADPDYAEAYAGLGLTYYQPVVWGWTGSPTRDLERAREHARHALRIDESTLSAYRLLGRIHSLRGEHDAGLLELERAIALNRNDAQSHAEQGVILLYAGQHKAALRSLELAVRLDPGMGFDYLMHLGMCYFLDDRLEEALASLERSLAANPENVFVHIVLVATYTRLGRHNDAQREVREVRRLNPFFKLESYGKIFRKPSDAARFVEPLRAGGLD